MAKLIAEWTEDDVLSLPSGENDTFERKSARLLDLTLPTVKDGDVLDELAKQLSAFANTGGGRIVYGLTNAGAVDNGGVPRVLRGRQSTKEWLEDVIPTLTDFEIVGCNVCEIVPKASGSALAPDRSLYVVDVPDSDRAPHQSSRDRKYYVRLGGKSQPAPHRLIEDIRNRARHPKLEVIDVHIAVAGFVPDQQGGSLTLYLQVHLRNNGKVRAANCCLMLCADAGLSTRPSGSTELSNRPAPSGTVLFEVQNPMYPGMSVLLNPLIVMGAALDAFGSLKIGGQNAADVQLSITTYADSAPAFEQHFRLGEIDPKAHLQRIQNDEYNRVQMLEFRRSPRTGPWS